MYGFTSLVYEWVATQYTAIGLVPTAVIRGAAALLAGFGFVYP